MTPAGSQAPGSATDGAEAAGSSGSRSVVVAAGILASRLLGLVRERAVAHFLGVGPQADVFRVALRAPNLLQNLLGEGTLSASFIPVYSRFVEAGRRDDARRLAGAVFGLLVAVAGGVAVLGVLLAEPIVTLAAPGFRAEAGGAGADRFALAVRAVRITFPMTGLLVLAAWCLGVLNSHRRFFLPYFGPVLWNVSIITGLLGGAALLVPPGATAGALPTPLVDRLLLAACAGALVGGLLQFLVQLPLAWKLLGGLRPSLSLDAPGLRRTLATFGPAVAGRGVVQLGSWFDLVLGSFLVAGGLAALGYAQILYMLPISLFAMSVAAAELPELSRDVGAASGHGADGDGDGGGRGGGPDPGRIRRSLGQILFLVVPTTVGYLAFGTLLTAALFETGSFDRPGTRLVALVLAAYALGLPASAVSRLLQNVHFAVSDTRTPARVAALRVALGATVAMPTMLVLDRVALAAVPLWGDGVAGSGTAGATLRLGALGLALGSAVGAWFELWRLRRGLADRVPALALPGARVVRMGGLALVAAAPAVGTWWALPAGLHPVLAALVVVAVYAAIYLGVAWGLGFPELRPWLGRLARRS